MKKNNGKAEVGKESGKQKANNYNEKIQEKIIKKNKYKTCLNLMK